MWLIRVCVCTMLSVVDTCVCVHYVECTMLSVVDTCVCVCVCVCVCGYVHYVDC